MISRALISLLVLFIFSAAVEAQTRRSVPVKKAQAVASVQPPEAAATEEDKVEIVPVMHQPVFSKRNQRPATEPVRPASNGISEAPPDTGQVRQVTDTEYSYEFSQPAFVVTRMLIRHDSSGKGSVTFHRKDHPEPISDPIRLSAATLERLRSAFDALNFLDSTEDYQHARDFSHLGTAKFTLSRDGRSRTAEFNWTDNKNAKLLADEYRKIGNEYIWRFDIILARENQPLETPRLMTRLDSLLRRNEISDPASILPFLNELENDERLPLIARNHATRMAKQIEKQAEKARK